MDLQPDFWGKRERAEEAQSLLGSHIYGVAIAKLKKDYLDEIAALPLGSPKILEVHAKVKVLEEVTASLRSYVNEYKFQKVNGNE